MTKAVVWKKVSWKFAVKGDVLVFKPLHENQISEAIAFFKREYPGIQDSYYGCYVERKFYRSEVALRNHWAKHARKKPILFYVFESQKTGKIVAAVGANKDGHLPLIVSNVAAVAAQYRSARVFKKLVAWYVRVVILSGIVHGISVASSMNAAAQRAYLDCGFKVCGIVPGGDVVYDKRGKMRFVADVYFHIFGGGGEKLMISDQHWDLVPEVRRLWNSIKAL